ncbi:MAG: hypothetical protein ACQCN4_03340 [Candidatus Bathyarchaeia archaeon]|jgi:hypothetical protein
METTLDIMDKNAYSTKDTVLSAPSSVALLSSIPAEKLNNSISDAFEYNRQLFALIFEAALMEKRVNGDNTAC